MRPQLRGRSTEQRPRDIDSSNTNFSVHALLKEFNRKEDGACGVQPGLSLRRRAAKNAFKAIFTPNRFNAQAHASN
jgi:hypothetical protein